MFDRIRINDATYYRLNWWYTPRTMVVWKWLAFAAMMWAAMYLLIITDVNL